MNVGIVGAGLIGKKRLDSILASPSGERVIAIADIDRKRAEDLAERAGATANADWLKIIGDENIDVVAIATPNKYVLEIALAAIAANKNVLCEKPLGRNADEASKICRLAQEKGIVLKTGFNHRHHPAIFKAHDLVEQGEIGKHTHIRCVYGHGGRPGYEKEWRASKDICGGGELLDQGVHVVDLFRWFLGDFDEAYGLIRTAYWPIEVEDNAFAIFKKATGQVAMMHTSWTQWKNRFLFEIFGDKGYLVINGLGGSYGVERLIIGKRKSAEGRFLGGAPDEETIEFPGADISWQEEWKEFTSAIKAKREPLGSGHDGWMANKMIDAVYRSAELNTPVKI
jgi:predicted dehydrogenase